MIYVPGITKSTPFKSTTDRLQTALAPVKPGIVFRAKGIELSGRLVFRVCRGPARNRWDLGFRV